MIELFAGGLISSFLCLYLGYEMRKSHEKNQGGCTRIGYDYGECNCKKCVELDMTREKNGYKPKAL